MNRDLLDLVRELNTLNDYNLADRVIENNDVQWCLSELQDILEEMPTITPPNEGAKDKNGPTNGPLTLEEIRLMIEPTPVWWDWVQGWVLARKGMIISWNGVYYNFGEVKGNFYRRPPEGESDA